MTAYAREMYRSWQSRVDYIASRMPPGFGMPSQQPAPVRGLPHRLPSTQPSVSAEKWLQPVLPKIPLAATASSGLSPQHTQKIQRAYQILRGPHGETMHPLEPEDWHESIAGVLREGQIGADPQHEQLVQNHPELRALAGSIPQVTPLQVAEAVKDLSLPHGKIKDEEIRNLVKMAREITSSVFSGEKVHGNPHHLAAQILRGQFQNPKVGEYVRKLGAFNGFLDKAPEASWQTVNDAFHRAVAADKQRRLGPPGQYAREMYASWQLSAHYVDESLLPASSTPQPVPEPSPPLTSEPTPWHELHARQINRGVDKIHRSLRMGQLPPDQAHANALDHQARMIESVDTQVRKAWQHLKQQALAEHGDTPATQQLLDTAKDRLKEVRDHAFNAIRERHDHPRLDASREQRDRGRSAVEESLRLLAQEPDSAQRWIRASVQPQARAMQLREALQTAERINRKLQRGESLNPFEQEQLKTLQDASRYWYGIPTSDKGMLGITTQDMHQKGEAHLPLEQGGWGVHHQTPEGGWQPGWKPDTPPEQMGKEHREPYASEPGTEISPAPPPISSAGPIASLGAPGSLPLASPVPIDHVALSNAWSRRRGTPLHHGLMDSSVVRSESLEEGINRSHKLHLDNEQKGIYKPERGEVSGLRDIVKGGYWRREVAASQIADHLGLSDLVPPTVARREGQDQGSLQHWIGGAKEAANFSHSARYSTPKDLARAAAFDFLTLNTDRHEGNWMLRSSPQGMKMTLIDHGLSFPDSHEQGEYANSHLLGKAIHDRMPIPSEIKDWAQHEGEISAIMKQNGLSQPEIDLTLQRLREMTQAAKEGKSFTDLWNQSGVKHTLITPGQLIHLGKPQSNIILPSDVNWSGGSEPTKRQQP